MHCLATQLFFDAWITKGRSHHRLEADGGHTIAGVASLVCSSGARPDQALPYVQSVRTKSIHVLIDWKCIVLHGSLFEVHADSIMNRFFVLFAHTLTTLQFFAWLRGICWLPWRGHFLLRSALYMLLGLNLHRPIMFLIELNCQGSI